MTAIDKPRKKPNKAERERRRTERADLYNEAFSHGYEIGYLQAVRDVEGQAQRNILKFSHRGR